MNASIGQSWANAAWAIGLALALGGCDGGRSTTPSSGTSSPGSANASNQATAAAVGQATPTSPSASSADQAGPTSKPGVLLVEVAQQLGIRNPQTPYPDGMFKTPEVTPGGVALFDYDNDGDLDILQICHCAPGSFERPSPCRLYQQQPDHTFREVPGAAGIDNVGFGHGVGVGDIDNDGDLDVYITNYGYDQLYLNDGKGHFENVTRKAGIKHEFLWSSSVAFFDYDRDGFLDLYVTRFATFNPDKICKASNSEDDFDYCGPHQFDGVPDTLYHNNGDGTFSDVTEKAGLAQSARGWGVTCADLTGDGLIDIYVANDEEPAQLWVNHGDGTFVDEAVLQGCAYSAAGKQQAGMGIALGDLDGDLRLDLLKTHIVSEGNTLYLRTSPDSFADRTAMAGMGIVDRAFTGWGAGFFDIDNDGDLDVAVANGRVSKGTVRKGAAHGKFWNMFAEPKLLFLNDGQGHMTHASASAGEFGSAPDLSRGMAFGDLDGDGDVDIVVNNLDNALRIYRNDAPAAGAHWLMIRARTGKRDAYGAELRLTAGQNKWLRTAQPAYSFLASNDPRAHFGLGSISKVDSLEILWPDGKRERFAVPAVDRVVTIDQGTGTPVK